MTIELKVNDRVIVRGEKGTVTNRQGTAARVLFDYPLAPGIFAHWFEQPFEAAYFEVTK